LEEATEKDVDDSSGATNKCAHPRYFVDALKQLTRIPDPENDPDLVKSIAMETLYTAHQPYLGE